MQTSHWKASTGIQCLCPTRDYKGKTDFPYSFVNLIIEIYIYIYYSRKWIWRIPCTYYQACQLMSNPVSSIHIHAHSLTSHSGLGWSTSTWYIDLKDKYVPMFIYLSIGRDRYLSIKYFMYYTYAYIHLKHHNCIITIPKILSVPSLITSYSHLYL